MRFPSLPYVVPFVAFVGLLALGSSLPLGPRSFILLHFAIIALLLWVCSRQVISFHAPHWAGSTLVGIGVFLIWITPELLVPGWRDHWLFSNGLTGRIEGVIPPDWRDDRLILAVRFARAALLVPIVEELFWRAWLPRWIDDRDDFRKVPLGQYTLLSFWITALLFASEHGARWDVGLAAGVIYNWWMSRTRKLGDLILAHGVTNACLSTYILLEGKWDYW